MPSMHHHKGARDNKANGKISRIRKSAVWIIVAVALLTIVVSLAVMFGKKKSAGPLKSTILVPLYVYPAPGAWDPLLTAIESHPSLSFTIVVNPESGPGAGDLPDGNYTREIPRLTAHANVRTVGYVSTDYGKRDLKAILRDISTYSRWAANTKVTGLGMQGIFLDETPSEYNNTSVESLQTIAAAIRSDTGFGDGPLIIHNPGTFPDTRYLSSCNLTVVFEGTYSTYQTYGFNKTISRFQSSTNCQREAMACIIHSFPPTFSSNDLRTFVKDVRSLTGSVFMTGLSDDYYASFWQGWPGFVSDMDG